MPATPQDGDRRSHVTSQRGGRGGGLYRAGGSVTAEPRITPGGRLLSKRPRRVAGRTCAANRSTTGS